MGDRLVAVTPAGFVQYPLLDGIEKNPWSLTENKIDLFRQLIRLEPAASQIQDAIAGYGDLKNEKIKRWHAGSRLASFFPTFSFGRDISKANNIDIDRGGTNNPDLFIAGPDDISRKWNMDIGWDLAKLIFSSNQTSIDSREKLMVELRNDMTSEGTRIYYERRRLQMEILFSPAESQRDHLEKLLRMDELTSLLDGMTGGFLSARLERIYSRYPELGELWRYTESSGRKNTQNPTQNNAPSNEQASL